MMDEFYDPVTSVVTWEDGAPWGCGYEPPSPEPVDFDYYYDEETYKRELEEQMKPEEIERRKLRAEEARREMCEKLTPLRTGSQEEDLCKIAQPAPKNAEVEGTETAHAETKDLRDPKEQARAHKRTQQQAKRRRCEKQQPQVDMATLMQNSPQVPTAE